MEEIKRQVRKAQTRLNLQQFLSWLPWTLFVTLLVAAIGLAVPKIWVVPTDPQTWLTSWLGGGLIVGLFSALILAYVYRRGTLEAAIELDRRFGLKERVSTSLALSSDERESEIGQALVTDAVRRVERVEVAEQFPLILQRPAFLPLIPALLAVALLFIQNAQPKQANANTTAENGAKTPKIISKPLSRVLAKLPPPAEKQENADKLTEAENALNRAKQEIKKLHENMPADRKDALAKLNDIIKDVEKQRQKLPSNDDLKKNFDKLKDIDKGPADKMADALKNGDLEKAKDELNKLKDQVAKGDLKPEDKQKLGDQLEKLKDKIEEQTKAREEAKKDLKEKIEQKKQEGDVAEASRLQKQLENMEAKDQQMAKQMEKMAEKFGDAAKAMKDPNGDAKEAADALAELGEDLDELKKQIAESDDLQELEQDLADAKEAMKCDECKGKGCKACEGKGKGNGNGEGDKEGQGDGMGKGQGSGSRPEEENDTKFYESRVKGNVKKGESVRIGDAGGPNVAGKSREEVKEAVISSLNREPDALQDGTLTREQREHAKQYFQKFRKGE